MANLPDRPQKKLGQVFRFKASECAPPPGRKFRVQHFDENGELVGHRLFRRLVTGGLILAALIGGMLIGRSLLP